MNHPRTLVVGIVAGLLLSACVGLRPTFPYKYYGLNADNYAGGLLGAEEKDDLPLDQCKPDDIAVGKCMVMFADDFYQLKSDYLKAKSDLIDCQGNQ